MTMKHYISFDIFRNKIVSLPADDSIWRMKCYDADGEVRTITFSKHLFEAEDGNTYPFVVYSFPMTLNAGIINDREDVRWDEDCKEVWDDILSCDLTPFDEC